MAPPSRMIASYRFDVSVEHPGTVTGPLTETANGLIDVTFDLDQVDMTGAISEAHMGLSWTR